MAKWIDIRQIVFPIGYVWMSTKNESPANTFGGTWTQITDERFWSLDSNAQEIGGSAFISENQLPKTTWIEGYRTHQWGANAQAWIGGDIPEYHTISKDIGQWSSNDWYGIELTSEFPSFERTMKIGGGQAYWPKSKRCYCWIRIA